MAGRPLDIRLRVAGWLELRGPLHVGGLGGDPSVDLPVAVDGRSRLYVPGTSLAGALRGWMTGTSARHRLGQLWGFVPDSDEPDPQEVGDPDIDPVRRAEGQASRVVLRDGLLCETADLGSPLPRRRLEIRTSVGIDRWTGTAAEGILFTRAIVPAGTYLSFELDVESTDETRARDRARLVALLDALRAGEISLGGAVSRGLGRLRLLDDVTIDEQDFAGKSGLLAFLRDGGQRRSLADMRAAAVADDAALTARRHLVVTVVWEPIAPVMVRADRAGGELDSLPLTGRVSDGPDGSPQLRLAIPGGSLKGVLRTRAELILRTVAGETTGEPASVPLSAEFHDQLRMAVLQPVWALFGEPPRLPGRRARDETPRRIPWGRGAAQVDDCVSADTLDARQWERLVVEKDIPADLRAWMTANRLEQADHVAIDRWTGGAADKLLFTVLEPWAVDWLPITVTLDLDRLDELENRPERPEERVEPGPESDVAVGLLLLVLRDLELGRLPIGQGVNRGFGDITASVTVRHPDDGVPRPLADYVRSDQGTRAMDAWRAYCASLFAVATATQPEVPA
ncbi:RAMP superfamily CRISPR-associated protein [Pseudofrankia sp. BMG5.37]|uniref:RAMP superfamily CRISPR-associated protein n=1 Tax=Pseudofrankia sp. BMG5.37 TaxID=3050035 RepID=UPI002895554D|nr:RAMP superfamily CRISPR-associated protein [Pseudofrankia sp. BMG5.37]MDT3440480.1 RAMP superfamily CRISPR-associated protein [Pseudofrankia sp. BMG5.37]